MITTVKELCEFIWKIEDKFDLLDFYIDDIPVWQCNRMKVYYLLAERTGIFSQAHRYKDGVGIKIRQLFNKIINSVKHNPLVIERDIEYLIFDHKRKLRIDGNYIDIYTDYIIKELDKKDILVLESMYDRKHWSEIKPYIEYEDYIELIASFNKVFKTYKFHQQEIKIIKEVEDYISEKLNVHIDLKKLISKTVKMLPSKIDYYENLFKKLQPKVIIIVVAYYRPEIVIAAKRSNIKVVEIQHGVISKYHLGYSYPNIQHDLEVFPNKIITFGEYWCKNIDIPIKNEDIIPLGFPYFNIKRDEFLNIDKKEKQILFISQGVIGKELSKIFYDLAKLLPNYKLIYKLHPGEVNDWKIKYRKLIEVKEFSNVIVEEGKGKSLYEYFAESYLVVGVFSTAMYEAFAFDCKGILVDLPGVEYMKDLIDSNVIKLAKDAIDIKEYVISDDFKNINSSMFFKQNIDINGTIQKIL